MYKPLKAKCYKTLTTLLTVGSILGLSTSCSAQQDYDPLEPINRSVFNFNEIVDTYLLKPVAQGYTTIIPEGGREHIGNVLNNLEMPLTFANSILQGDVENTLSSFWGFVLNSTFGLLGTVDFAGNYTTLKIHQEDFGQTLGVWGVPENAYLVLPLLGPSTTRDAFGSAVDMVSDPFNLAEEEITIIYNATDIIHTRSTLLNLLDDVYESSLDPYATIRSGYLQSRRAAIKNTKSEVTNEGF